MRRLVLPWVSAVSACPPAATGALGGGAPENPDNQNFTSNFGAVGATGFTERIKASNTDPAVPAAQITRFAEDGTMSQFVAYDSPADMSFTTSGVNVWRTRRDATLGYVLDNSPASDAAATVTYSGPSLDIAETMVLCGGSASHAVLFVVRNTEAHVDHYAISSNGTLSPIASQDKTPDQGYFHDCAIGTNVAWIFTVDNRIARVSIP